MGKDGNVAVIEDLKRQVSAVQARVSAVQAQLQAAKRADEDHVSVNEKLCKTKMAPLEDKIKSLEAKLAKAKEDVLSATVKVKELEEAAAAKPVVITDGPGLLSTGTTTEGGVIRLGSPLQPSDHSKPPSVILPPPSGHDPWFRCAYYSNLINNWYGRTAARRVSLPDGLVQERKFYVDIAVLAAKKHWGADEAKPNP